ncbi:MAG: NADH-quinone oxidoreductase subunit NuoF [Acidobacteria bacterium]|nr:NADH-quinone oxidoreductase subunit NuoF [Acidobacteriota bacterium]
MSERILSKRFGLADSHTIGVYEATGGYATARRVLQELTPAQVTDEVKKSNLRGRGGAGFPTGLKWSFIPRDTDRPVYLCVNADESEPGTFKDRHIMEQDPHLLLEGIIISAYAIGCHQAYIYIRGEYIPQIRRLRAAIQEAYGRGCLGRRILGSGFDLEVAVFTGAGAYICGEETALLESLEGKKGYPRLKPPFPAVVGLYGCPTIINNVETLANVPAILEKGGDWFAAVGANSSGGTRLFGVSGHVTRPGVYERPMGYSLKQLIFKDAGGILDGRTLKAVIPGGSSVPVLRADEIDIALDFESVAAAGSMLGSAGVIVMHDGTCMVRALQRLIHFYKDESCGQCSPCREGTGWLLKIINRIIRGDGRPEDVDVMRDVAEGILGNTICPLGDAAALPVISFVTKFRDEFEHFVRHKRSAVLAPVK